MKPSAAGLGFVEERPIANRFQDVDKGVMGEPVPAIGRADLPGSWLADDERCRTHLSENETGRQGPYPTAIDSFAR